MLETTVGDEQRKNLIRARRVRRVRGLSTVAAVAALISAFGVGAYGLWSGNQAFILWALVPLLVAILNLVAYWEAPSSLLTARRLIIWSVIGGLGISVIVFGLPFGAMALFLAWTVVLSAMLFGPGMLLTATLISVVVVALTGVLQLWHVVPLIPLDMGFISWGNFILGIVYPVAMAWSVRLYADYIQDTLNDAATRLQEQAEIVVGSAQQQASASQELAAAVQQISATAEELSRTTEQIAAQGLELDSIVDDGYAHIQAGEEEIMSILEALDHFAQEMRGLSQDITNLGQQSQKMGEIVELINRLSDETHLIALNAAIEAAGAGEHGKRFAVIAAEIRRLAENSIKSGEQIKDMVRAFQEVITNVVETIESEIKEVGSVSGRAESARGRLQEMVQAVGSTRQAAHDLANAAEDLRSVSQQLAMSLQDLSQAADEIAENSQHNLETAKVLVDLAASIAKSGV